MSLVCRMFFPYLFLILCSVVLAAPFMKEEEAKGFIRLKRQSGYWDPHHSQNQWGYTIQEQVTDTALWCECVYTSLNIKCVNAKVKTLLAVKEALYDAVSFFLRLTSTGQPFEQMPSTTWT